MTYSEIMIQAYMEAKGISREEAIQHFGIVGTRVKRDKKNLSGPLNKKPDNEILEDLRNDPEGVLGWLRNRTE